MPVNEERRNQVLKELDSIPADTDKLMAKLAYASEESAKPLNDKLDKLEARKKELHRILTSMREVERDEQLAAEKAAQQRELQRKDHGKVETIRKVDAEEIVCKSCGGPVTARKPEVARPGWWSTATNTPQDWKKWWIPIECQNIHCMLLDRYYPDQPPEEED